MSKYEIKVIGTLEAYFSGRATDSAAFRSALLHIKMNGVEADAVYFIAGKQVSIDDAIAECNAISEAAYIKKSETHKRVTINTGAASLPNNKREVWVRK